LGPTGITPTSYDFTVIGVVNEYTTTQASAVFTYTVKEISPTIKIIATDGSDFAAVSSTITVNQYALATSFITKIETNTSDTVADRQVEATNLFVYWLSGNETTNSTDLITDFSGTDSCLYPCLPIDETTASFDAYKVDLLDSTHEGVYGNMVSGDITVNAVTGGSTKYFNAKVQPSDFDQNSIMFHFYQSEFGMENGTAACGVHVTNNNSDGCSFFPTINNKSVIRVNTSSMEI